MKEGPIARTRRAALDAAEARSEGGGHRSASNPFQGAGATSRGGGGGSPSAPPSWGNTARRLTGQSRGPRRP